MKKGKWVALVIAVGISVGLLIGCGEKPLADNIKEDEVRAKAEEVIESLNAFDYEKTESYFSSEMKEALPVEKLEEAVDGLLKDAGPFVEYENVKVIGKKNKESDENNAVVILKVKYENKKYQYTVSFEPDMEVNGLFMK